MLFDQIIHNKRKTIFIIFLFIFLFISVGVAVGLFYLDDPISGAIIAGVIGVVYTLFILLNTSSIIMGMNHAKQVKEREQHPLLWDTVEQMALVAQIPMPKVYIIYDDSLNAFATGFSPEKSCVAVTRGLLSKLEQYELEAVVAHEISHIRNYDVRLSSIALALVAVVTFISDIVGRSMRRSFRGGRRSGNSKNGGAVAILYLAAIILIAIAPILASLLQLFLSRNREYLADASAVELTRNPDGLINALKKISQMDIPMQEGSYANQSIYFAAFKNNKKQTAGWFDTHPPIILRIERLMNM